jgi:hypothetical protein
MSPTFHPSISLSFHLFSSKNDIQNYPKQPFETQTFAIHLFLSLEWFPKNILFLDFEKNPSSLKYFAKHFLHQIKFSPLKVCGLGNRPPTKICTYCKFYFLSSFTLVQKFVTLHQTPFIQNLSI